MYESIEFWLEISGLGLSVLGFGLMSAEWWITAKEAGAAARQELEGKHHVPPSKIRDAYKDLTETKSRLIAHPKESRDQLAELSIRDVVRIIQLAEIGAIQSSAREIAQDRTAKDAEKTNVSRLRLFALGAVTTFVGFVLQFAAQTIPLLSS
jgi:hypothetical protein